MTKREHKERFKRLQRAVVALYSVAFWRPDREVENETALWEELRDAAELNEGMKSLLLDQTASCFDDER